MRGTIHDFDVLYAFILAVLTFFYHLPSRIITALRDLLSRFTWSDDDATSRAPRVSSRRQRRKEKRKESRRVERVKNAIHAARLNARLRGTSWKKRGSRPCTSEDHEEGWDVGFWFGYDMGPIKASIRKAWSSVKIYARSDRFLLGKYERRHSQEGKMDTKDCQTTATTDDADTRQPATGRGHIRL
jgi:hypothetical protein